MIDVDMPDVAMLDVDMLDVDMLDVDMLGDLLKVKVKLHCCQGLLNGRCPSRECHKLLLCYFVDHSSVLSPRLSSVHLCSVLFDVSPHSNPGIHDSTNYVPRHVRYSTCLTF